jgi:DMSO/TMAO reductase YedYZ molybdopterin-dependent catalytic subunit
MSVVPRRRVLQLLAMGGVVAARGPVLEARQEIVKAAPPELFVKSGSNLEMRWAAMYSRGYIVSNELFFVRHNSRAVPRIDPAAWRLRIEGSGLSRPSALTYDDLLGMPSVSVIRAIECAGNGRNFFKVSQGAAIPGTPWNLGGIGVAEWTGVPLRDVLERAGVTRGARDVMPEGADERRVSRPIPIEKAMADDTLLVYAMNGQPLPPDHGFPVRLLVPGWVGVSHVKWVQRIEVSEQPLYSEYNTQRYVLIGPGYEAKPPARGVALTTQKVKSAFELPWEGRMPAGRRLLRGRSWSGEAASPAWT